MHIHMLLITFKNSFLASAFSVAGCIAAGSGLLAMCAKAFDIGIIMLPIGLAGIGIGYLTSKIIAKKTDPLSHEDYMCYLNRVCKRYFYVFLFLSALSVISLLCGILAARLGLNSTMKPIAWLTLIWSVLFDVISLTGWLWNRKNLKKGIRR